MCSLEKGDTMITIWIIIDTDRERYAKWGTGWIMLPFMMTFPPTLLQVSGSRSLLSAETHFRHPQVYDVQIQNINYVYK